MRFICMSENTGLTRGELDSLKEVASGFLHKAIPETHAARLLELKLIYSLLGSYRLTADGRQRLRNERQD